MKMTEMRDMSDEQLELMVRDTAKNLFRLRMQANTERLDVPSELKRHRQIIARIRTIQHQRTLGLAGSAKGRGK